LDASQGKLMLAGISEHAYEQLDRTETTDDLLGDEGVFEETEIFSDSVLTAQQAAQIWLDDLETVDHEIENGGKPYDTGKEDNT